MDNVTICSSLEIISIIAGFLGSLLDLFSLLSLMFICNFVSLYSQALVSLWDLLSIRWIVEGTHLNGTFLDGSSSDITVSVVISAFFRQFLEKS